MRRNDENLAPEYLRQKVGKLRYIIGRDGSRKDRLLDLLAPRQVISIVGAGGKTSTMFTLGCELAAEKSKVVLTTSTRILPFQNPIPDGIELRVTEAENGKLKAVDNIGSLKVSCDYLLIEADGSRALPIKVPASHEPVIIQDTEQIIAVLGLSCIGKPIGKVCHRRELVSSLLGKSINEVITVDDAVKIILSEKGLAKNVENREFTVILNQADSDTDIETGLRIAEKLPDRIRCYLTAYEDFD